MWIEFYLCCFLLLQRSAGQSQNLYYLVTMPAEIHYPSKETVCAHIKGIPKSARLTVILQSVSRDDVLIDQSVVGPDFSTCTDFQVPPPYDGSKEVARVQVTIEDPVTDTLILDSKKVLMKRVMNRALIVTDKPSYNPGDTVKIQTAIFDRNFLPSNDKVPVVDIQDPNIHHIAQWWNLTPQQGIIALKFDLSPDAVLGTYTINLEHLETRTTFVVEKTVLQKFEVLILSFPSVVTLKDTSFELKVCGRYTYVKPTQGHIDMTVCRRAKHFSWSTEGRVQDICVDFSGQTDSFGCLSWSLNTSNFQPSTYGYQMTFDVVASLVEEGTDVKVKTTSSFPLSSTIAVVTFDNTDTYYKTSVPFKVKMRLASADGTPMKGESLFLVIEVNSKKTELTSVTDGSGSAYFTVDTFSWDGNTVYLKGIYKKEKPVAEPGYMASYYKDAIMTVTPFHSLLNTLMNIHPPDDTLSCGLNHELEVDYIVRGSDLAGGDQHLLLHYLVLGRGRIVQNGQKLLNVSRTSVLRGSFGITVPINADIAPLARILIFMILPSGKVSADSSQFKVSKCFNNKVSLEFSEFECLPSSSVSLWLNAEPGSLCAVRVLDKSILLERPAAELTNSSIYRLLPVLNQVGYPDSVMEVDPPCQRPRPWYQKRSLPEQLLEVSGHPVRKRSIGIPFSNQNQRDVFSIFQNIALKIITNTEVKKAPECHYYYPPVASQTRDDDELGATLDLDETSTLYTEDANVRMKSQLESIRSYFPKTWVWDLIPIDSSGTASMSLTVPDTITDWEASMFCMADAGFGLSAPARLRTFKSFFMEMRLPYSLIRGESSSINAILFNYMPHEIQVRVTMKRREGFEMKPCRNCTYTSCLRAQESKIFSWNVTATALGVMTFQVTAEALDKGEICDGERPAVSEDVGTDTVVKEVLVQAEGVLVELSHSSLLCAEGNLSTEVIPIDLPKEVIPGSATAQFSIIGDMMGNALQNMNNHLAMPYGSGKETMSKLAPNIFIVQYLESSGQLTEPIKRKAVQFLEQGYERILNYRRSDGSFSPFGERDPEGNMWLTALVVKSLYATKSYIQVDEHYIREAAAWIEDNQLPSGAFRMKGRLFKSLIKERAYTNDDESIALASFVIISLLECDWQPEDPMLEKGLQYLRNAVPAVENPCLLAMMAYGFTLSGKRDEGNRALLLRKLYKQAVEQDGQVYWNLKSKQGGKSQFWSQPDSSEVEVASYALLAHLSKADPSREEIAKASQIAAWIPRQQNAQGGFATMQDTVVALQAMASYTKLLDSGTKGTNVTVTSPTGFQHDFTVNNSTRLLLQEVWLPDVPGEYRAQAQGNGCVYSQTTVRYHIPPPKSNLIFALSVEVKPWNCSVSIPMQLNLTIHVRYTGPWPASNVALIIIKMLSGYSANLDSVKMIEKNPLVKKTEVTFNEVIVYMDQLTSKNQTLTFSMKQDIPVRNQQPEFVKVYDYYKPDDNAVVKYNSPCPSR
ncbi:alpha-2-macroglobulin-like protein 1 [Microcaecilia unicolor]|uniref:Alpha-2-macroglobulin-like protein 1 n=1 Tax=Microcaecilia unicolor TaxID=1415580 RepID=A0A6P7WPR8_9AMPH|nr:alpha-2-macroglobulin-like protein 1 [Microcaecilia unicolor]